jgi:sulfhydrogenase subunit gamma (sulfur reductase)
MHITVDGTDDPEWKYNKGFVPAVAKQKITSADNAIAIVCGPPVMIRFTQPVLQELGFPLNRPADGGTDQSPSGQPRAAPLG